ncbi:MAG: CvpA family protein [Bacteroidota bacterium]
MVIDIIFAIVAGYGFYLGFSKGIIQTIFTILSVTFGLMAGFKFGPQMTKFLETSFNTEHALMFIAGFLLSFVLTMMFIRLFARGIEGLLQTANINIINQVAGGFLLAGMMILLFSMILWFGDKSHLIDKATKDESISYTYLEEFPSQVWYVGEQVKPIFEEFWDHSVDFMDKLEQGGLERAESEPNIYDLPDDD